MCQGLNYVLDWGVLGFNIILYIFVFADFIVFCVNSLVLLRFNHLVGLFI